MNSKLKPYNYRWLLLAFAIIWACVIFNFSHQGNGISSAQSGAFVAFFSKFPALNELNKTIQLEILVRKAAHMFEYAVLGGIVMCYLSYYNLSAPKKIAISILSCAVYGTSDEIHQMFVPGRSARLFDVGFDTAGGAIGAILALIIIVKVVNRKKKSKSREQQKT